VAELVVDHKRLAVMVVHLLAVAQVLMLAQELPALFKEIMVRMVALTHQVLLVVVVVRVQQQQTQMAVQVRL
jgi:hypothetical protein